MGGLNVHADDQNSSSQSKKRQRYKSPKLIFGLAVLIAVPVIGTTLAATNVIRVNNDTNISFGQGIAAALACDEDVVITPRARYVDAGWYLYQVEISGINTTADFCAGKRITLAGYEDTSPENQIANSETSVTLTSSGPADVTHSGWTSGDFTDQVAVDNYGGADTKITISYGDDTKIDANYSHPGVDYRNLTYPLKGFLIQQQG
jgi:hypothetical protein